MCALVALSSNLFAETITLSNTNGTVTKNGNITVTSGEYIGMLDGTTLKDDYFTSGVFTQSLMLQSGSWLYKYHDLTIAGTGRVVVAGKYDSSTFAGITANKVTVNGEDGVDNLIASTLLVNSLEVSGGNVELHTNLNSGGQFTGGNSSIGYMPSTSLGALMDADARKMVTIREELKVTGGTLTIGVTNGQGITTKTDGSLQYHYLSGFGKAINQEGGQLTVHDMSLASGNLTITQTGGVMSLSATSNADSRKVLAFDGAGTCKIEQSGDDSVMTLGRLTTHSGNGNNVTITQNGGGIISLTQGADFKANGTSSITQNGSGDIYLSGSFVNTAYNISQTGENITNPEEQGNIYIGSQLVTVNGENTIVSTSAFVTAGTVNQTAGILSVSDKATLNASSVNVGGTFNVAEGGSLVAGAIKVTEGGTLINNGVISSTSAAMLAADDEIAALANDDMLIVIAGGSMENYGQTDKNILVQDGGTLTLGEKASVGGVEITGGNINVNGDVTVSGALTLTGGTVTFMEDAVITLADGVEVAIEGASIVVNLSDAALDSLVNGGVYTLFDTTSDLEAIDGSTMTFVGTSGDTITTTVNYAGKGAVELAPVVPEPTTATLSLLALAGLAARRRRK